jgi:hypothetical protein
MADRKKEDFMSQIQHYRAVLEDLQGQRAMHQLKIAEIDAGISALRRLIPSDTREELAPHETTSEAPSIHPGKYAGMSVRWSVLNLLAEDSTRPMGTGEIAEALERGGIISNGKNFAANVSAVLSNMNNERREVLSTDNGWVISDVGRQAWAHIRVRRLEQQKAISSSVQ